jgi:hypothetical protein
MRKRLAVYILVISFLFSGQTVNGNPATAAAVASGNISPEAAAASQAAAAAGGAEVGFAHQLYSQCTSGVMGAAACVLAVLEGVQAIMSLMDSGNSNQAVSATQMGLPGIVTPSTDVTGNASGSTINSGANGGLSPAATASLNQAKGILASLANQGYSLSPDGSTVSTPNGSVPAATANTADGMKAMGMTDQQIADTMDFEKKLAAKAAASLLKNGGADGGGGGGAPSYAAGGSKADKFDLNGLFSKGAKARKPASVSGLSKKLGADPIGVSGDNIFEMITRRYQKKDAENSFLKN